MFYRLCWPADGKFATCAPYDPVYETILDDVCPLCGRNLVGRYWQHPRTLKIIGKRFPDFLFTTPYPAVSERFRDAYQNSTLKGILKFDEIENYRLYRSITTTPKYYTIKVIRSQMEVDYTKSVITWGRLKHEHYCPLCDPQSTTVDKIERLILCEENYQGEDIFTLCPTSASLYLSERFVEFVRENHLTNLGIMPLDQMEKRIVVRQ